MDYRSSINKLLKGIGVRRVTDINVEQPDVVDAKDELDEARVTLLTRGWWFNRVRNVTMTRDALGRIKVPTNVLSIQLSDKSQLRDYPELAIQDEYLYNLYDDTRVFTQDMTFDVLRDIPWDSMPPTAQQYAMYNALAQYIDAKLEDTARTNTAKDSAMEQLTLLNAEEINSLDLNMFNNPAAARLRSGYRPYRLQIGD